MVFRPARSSFGSRLVSTQPRLLGRWRSFRFSGSARIQGNQDRLSCKLSSREGPFHVDRRDGSCGERGAGGSFNPGREMQQPGLPTTGRKEISNLGLERNVSILGERHDVSGIPKACDIGVLSSTYEGLPMSLLEYGAAGLAAVATSVGQCVDVLDKGRAGILVPPQAVDSLSAAIRFTSAIGRRAIQIR